ncbi:serine/threonine-protein kinase/endoribonuclease IRE1-like isoform X2 [Xenia sp. Carnegie-2017]|uniref:serine/threonine-protein kinase/endoribonuclease IRE1-like isoform X2 n=1 Tax=Xenia sp. Carnegie-2017 TaxID=2897299 RepID=UPI001F03AE24|nr:serine/threonine-protein kinase/endoribonuclease IRE1-like isoform X2 [Xenia sp. Carnegie-2017]
MQERLFVLLNIYINQTKLRFQKRTICLPKTNHCHLKQEVRKLNVPGEDHTHVTSSLSKFYTMYEKTENYESQKTQSKFPVPSHAHVFLSSKYFGLTSGDDGNAKDVGNSPVVEITKQGLTSGDDGNAKDVGNSPVVEITKQGLTSGDDGNAKDVGNSPVVEITKQGLTSGDDGNAKDVGNSPVVEITKQGLTSGDDGNAKDVGNSPVVEITKQESKLQEWKYNDESKKHKKMFSNLLKRSRDDSVEVKQVSDVRVIFSDDFCIGKGSNETRVFLGLRKDGYGKAVKRIRRDNCMKLAQKEKEILNQFNAKRSKYVVNYSFLEEDTGTEYVYLILDLCEESLESYVKSSTLVELQNALPEILRQILQGLADLHSGENPIIHRDLKPTNVLRDSQDNFLIADFGISQILNNDCTTYESSPNTGTEYWIAPESYCEKEDFVDKGRYKKESDIYNAGMVTYYIATKGKHPFGTKRLRLDNMLKGNPVGLEEIEDETLKDLLSWMLNLKPENRPSATVALKHPFLMSDDEKFDLLCKVGNLQQIKTNDPLCSVVQQLNSESSDWKSKIDSDVYDYFRTDVVTGKIFTYDSSWTECLRLIRNINQHWNDRPRPKPQPEPFYKIGDHKAYILKKFPNLPIRVHASVRCNVEVKNNPDLKNFFNFSEKKPHQK